MRVGLLMLMTLLMGVAVVAQEDRDLPLDVPIAFDAINGDTITEEALYDWWVIYLSEGDTIQAEMQGYDGLAPLLGVIGENRDTLVRSDDIEGDADVDGIATLEFRAETQGEYRIVTSRAGGAAGTTTGTYTILVTLISSIPTRENRALETQFRCNEMLINNALTINFAEDVVIDSDLPAGAPIEAYTLVVAGYDGMEPAVRLVSESIGAQLDCTRDAAEMEGVILEVPGEPSLTITNLDNALRLNAISTSPDLLLGDLTFSLGALEGTSGRYVLVLQGRSIDSRRAPDTLNLRLAPRARASTITLYMISDKNSRLDPYIALLDPDGNPAMECDDAGSRACPDVPSARDLRVMADGNVVIEGGRFDAGLIFQPNTTDEFTVLLASKNFDTTGPYTIVIVAEFD